jgi:hypothetical protein
MRLRIHKVTKRWLALTIIVTAALSCARGPELKGVVRDAGAKPVAGAHIVLVGPGNRKTETDTSSDGTYSVRLSPADSADAMITISAEKPGLMKFERHLSVGDALKEPSIDLILGPPRPFPTVPQIAR